jgi:hypothetical protein
MMWLPRATNSAENGTAATQNRQCHDLAKLPIGEMQIESLRMSDIRLGKSIYTKKQLDEFAAFQDSQGTHTGPTWPSLPTKGAMTEGSGGLP